MDFGGTLGKVKRDPRIKVTGRRCTTCPQDAPLAFTITQRLPGLPPFQLVFCTACILRVVEMLHTHHDANITIDAEQARVHLA